MTGHRSRRWSVITDAVRTELWPLPALGVVLAIAAAVVITRVDRRVDAHLTAAITDYLFSGSADAARSVLGTIASSLITVTSLTFSLTVVTLQLASSQFSPRLLRTFSRDRFVHLTLALFLSTFAYSLTVLRSVRAGSGSGPAAVPQIAVTAAYALTVLSVLALVAFLSHLAREVRVETMLRNVHADADDTVERAMPLRGEELQEPVSEPLTGSVPAGAVPLTSAHSGFLTFVEAETLLTAAQEAEGVLRVDACPGAIVVAGTPVAYAWSVEPGDRLDDERIARLTRGVCEGVRTGFERTSAQDVGYGLRQLTDVVLKALSPGINDPTTACHALGHLSALLCSLAGREDGPELLHDAAGRVRVSLARPRFEAMLDLVLDQPRHYGCGDVAVVVQLFTVLRQVAWTVRLPAHRAAVRRHLTLLTAAVETSDTDLSPARVDRLTADVLAALDGEWPPQQ